MKYLVDIATKRNTKAFNKPNEDCAFADGDNCIFIIMDGVSRDKINGVYPNPSPAFEVSKLFIETGYNYIKYALEERCDYLQIVKEAFKVGNNAIYEFNNSYVGNFLPGTVGIIAIIGDKNLYYGYIGDCLGILVKEQMAVEFTTCQTKYIHEHIKEFTSEQIRNEICNNVNHPYSYGVLDGREGAMDFIITGELSLDKCSRILLLTDGVEEIVKQMSVEELLNTTAKELLNKKVHIKSSDDKTIIIVRMDTDENSIENN